MNYRHLNYDECVSRGIELVEQLKQTKYEICLLTLRACDIRLGGHGVKQIYSIKKFAEDIGMSYNTLSKWIEEHRNVVSKLPEKPKAEDYRVIREVLRHVTKETPSNQVIDLYNTISSYTDEDYKLLRIIKDMKGIRNFIIDHNMVLFNQDNIKELEQLLEYSLMKIKEIS